VGQANLVVIRHNDYSLIIDCGNSHLERRVRDQLLDNVSQFIENSILSIVVTHQHDDHYNLIKQICRRLPPRKIWIGGLCHRPNTFAPQDLRDIPNAQFCEVCENGVIQDAQGQQKQNKNLNVSTLQGRLGNDVGIQLILPPKSVGQQEHDQNLVLKVTYNGKFFFFPGDANSKLLDAIITHNRIFNSPDQNDIHFMLLSHHGSNEHGELEWFRQVHQRNPNIVTIVSSNPAKGNHLPWNMVKDLSGWEINANAHLISVRGPSEDEDGKNFVPVQHFTQKPLFTTCNVGLYYAITISNRANMRLTGYDMQNNAKNLFPKKSSCSSRHCTLI
jgi:beta-lactamase superfamily II metal-dependent hydrolase